MLIVVFFEPDMVRIERMMQHIADTFPEITSLLYIVNQKRNDTIADQEVCVFRGRDYSWFMIYILARALLPILWQDNPVRW